MSTLLVITSFSVFGQNEIKGTVVDQDGKVLIGVNIIEKGTENGTITGIDGSFKLLVVSDTIILQYIGYKQKIIKIKEFKTDLIVLEEKNIAYRYEYPIEINAQYILSEQENITTLSNRILKIASPGNTNEVLNTISGLHMQSGGYNTNKLSIRGIGSTSQFASSDVKTFYNNIPIHNSIGESAIEDIGLHMADKIEVIKGTTGSMHEAGYGGAIILKNINTRSEEKTEVISNNTIGKWGHFTSQNQINIGRTDRINSHNFSVYHSLVTDNGYRSNNQFDRNNVTLNYTINKKGKLKMTALVNRVDLKAFIPSSLNKEDYEIEPSKAAFTWNKAKGNEDYSRTLAGLNIDYEFDFKRTMSHTLYGHFFESSELRPFNTIDESSNTYGIKGNFQYNRPGYAEVYTIGYRVQQEGYDFDLFETEIDTKGIKFNNGNEQRSIYELFTMLESEINEKWSYKLGINTQYSIISADANKVLDKVFILPEATFSYRPSNNTRIYASAGKGINYFSPQQALLPNGTYSTNLFPNSAWNFSIGSKGILIDKLQYRGEIYQLWANNLITIVRDETNQPINANDGNANYSGLELGLKYLLIGKYKDNKNLTIDLQYNLMKNKYSKYVNDEKDYTDNIIPGTPSQTAFLLIAGNYNGWYTNIRYQYIDAYHMRDDNTIKSDPYQLINATLGYNIIIDKWTISPRFDIINLTNEKYASMTLVNASSFGGNPPRYYYPGRPINGLASINIKYSI